MSAPLKPLRWYKKLATKKGRLEAGAFLVEGDRAIKQIISSHPDEIIEIITIEEPLPAYRNYAVQLVTESQFRSICLTRTPQGTMAVVRLPVDMCADYLPEAVGNKVLLLEDIQDPGNVGTLIRTAAAFDFSGVIMTENCADPLSPKCVQATAGTVLSVWFRRTKRYLELIKLLRKGGYTLIAAELNGVAEPSILHRQSKLLLALGNEAAGLSRALLDEADYRLRIPTVREKAESLNVAACGAICMYLSSPELIR
ncbi:MAG: RNA methyltransferase [Dehalococcoidales bacterium]|nr:RNA methyltransferase [Dehalococcoidales bacterium]